MFWLFQKIWSFILLRSGVVDLVTTSTFGGGN